MMRKFTARDRQKAISARRRIARVDARDRAERQRRLFAFIDRDVRREREQGTRQQRITEGR